MEEESAARERERDERDGREEERRSEVLLLFDRVREEAEEGRRAAEERARAEREEGRREAREAVERGTSMVREELMFVTT